MVIDNETTMLIKVDSAEDAEYTINGKYYKKSEEHPILTAVNERRSYLNLSKKVVDQDGKDVEISPDFTFTVTINEAAGEDVWLSAFDTKAGQTVMDPSIVTGSGVEYQESDGYFHAPSGTTLTLKLKDGWNYRFINLHTNSTYTIEENTSNLPSGCSLAGIVPTATNEGTPATVSNAKAEGTIDQANTNYTVAYTNKIEIGDLELSKILVSDLAILNKIL